MEFDINTTEDKETDSTIVEIIFEDGKALRAHIHNWKNDDETRGVIARTVYNIVNKYIQEQLKKTIEEKGFTIKHGGRPRKNDESDEKKENHRKSSLAYYYRQKAKIVAS